MGRLIDLKLRQEGIPGLAELGVGAQYFPGYRNFSADPYLLDVTLLSVVMRGTCTHLIGPDRFERQGPNLDITPAGTTQCTLTGPDGIDVMNIYLDLDRLRLPVLPEPFAGLMPLLFPLRPRFNNRLNRIMRTDLQPGEKIAATAFGMADELAQQRPGWETAVEDYLRIFLLEACRCLAAGEVKPAVTEWSAATVRLDTVRNWLDAHYSEPVTLEQLAKKAGCSRNYLCRAFKNYSGKTVFDYLLERRIQAAMMRLRGSEEKIIGIAYDCGFHELSYFNRVFKRLTGQTPLAYRRKGRQITS